MTNHTATTTDCLGYRHTGATIHCGGSGDYRITFIAPGDERVAHTYVCEDCAVDIITTVSNIAESPDSPLIGVDVKKRVRKAA